MPVLKDTIVYSHPLEVVREIRRLRRIGEPIPDTLMVTHPQCKRLLANMVIKVGKLTGNDCPNLVVLS